MSEQWNSLEVAKLTIGILTPAVLVFLGWFISYRLKRLDLIQWSNQKLIEKRLEIYDIIAPLLNQLLCFYMWIGDWKDISPDEIIKTKRELDKKINIYRYLFTDDVHKAYQSYFDLLFETYTAPGQNARIRSRIKCADGDRTHNCTYTWESEWDAFFSIANIEKKIDVRNAYLQLMETLRTSLGTPR